MRRLLAIVAVLALTVPAGAYLKFGVQVDQNVVPLKWAAMPVRFFVTNKDATGVTADQLKNAFQRAFDTWSRVPTAVVSSQFAGFTSAQPFDEEGMTVFGFQARTDLDRTLAATTFVIDERTGGIIESDIFVNTLFDWSVAAGGDPARFDLESVALHELGHLLGLGHSLLGETELQSGGGRRVIAKNSVMFPIAYSRGSVEDRVLKSDDIAGISDVYSTPAFDHDTGAVTGRVTHNGVGVFGAHVIAYNRSTGEMVGGFSLTTQGDFVIAGLAPGVYVIRAEPLDDADLDSFFDEDSFVDTSFRATFFDRLVGVPAGGASSSIEIKVVNK